MDRIGYNFAGMDVLSGDLNAQFTALGELANQLKSIVSNLQNEVWQSGGAGEYQAAQAHWDMLFEEARANLHGLGKGVSNAAETMMNADRQVGASFRV
ncbi:MAG: WXG100 family type VII secretion target [Actinomycetota bacterium]|nr:WXG100 family type VII secretion target [Actinomycetota bacterium]